MKKLSEMLFSGAGGNETLGGLYQWPKAFAMYGKGGECSAHLIKEFLEKHDIIQVNVTPNNMTYVSGLREVLGKSDTKIVANVDFGLLMWTNIDPLRLRTELEKADFVFHVESMGAARLSKYLGRHVPCLSHPVNVDAISKLRVPTDYPIVISAQYHRYMPTWCEYYWATYNLRKKHEALRVVIHGLTGDDRNLKVPINALFDEVIGWTNYETHCKLLARSYINMDTTPDYTYGRGIVDAATLGVPTVGSNTIDAMKRIWPQLCCGPVDTIEMEKKLEKLLGDSDFAADMSLQGIERAKYYGLRHSYNRLVKALEEQNVI